MKAEEFSNLKYDPISNRRKPMWLQYPDFQRRRDLCEIPLDIWDKNEMKPNEKDLDAVLRYVVLFCTKQNNPIARERDLSVRRELCYEFAGIEKGAKVRDWIEAYHPWVVKVMTVYMRLLNDREYANWLALLISSWMDTETLMFNPATAEDPEKLTKLKQLIRNSMPANEKALMEAERRVFPDDESARAATSLETLMADGPGGYAEYFVARDFARFQ